MPRLPWISRTFSFDFPVETFPDVIERFRGTPARLEDRLRPVPPATLTRSDGGWSIQENAGHLLDLEPLFRARIDDFLAGAPILRAADITNAATRAANHNDADIADILTAFRAARAEAVSFLESLDDADFARTSIHPRLKTPMRLIDAIAFVCAHDDYHLARISELIRLFA